MAQKQALDKLSIYIPQSKIDQKPVEPLIALGEKKDRSVNYLVVEAILEVPEPPREGGEERLGSCSSEGLVGDLKTQLAVSAPRARRLWW